MCKKQQRLMLCAFVMIVVLGNAAWGDLVGRWKLDETSGTVAADSSNNGLDGTLRNGGTWVAGQLGGAWQGDGADDYIDLGTPDVLDLSGAGQATITAWVNPAVTKNHNAIVTKGEWRDAYSVLIKGDTSPPNLLWTGNDTSIWSAEPVPLNEWTHVAVTINGNLANFYINGMLNGPANQDRGGPIDNNPADHTEIGREDRSDDGTSARWYFNGMLDDARIYNEALPAEQIQEIMLARDRGLELATDPVPGDGQTDVSADTILSWTPGPHAATHDVISARHFLMSIPLQRPLRWACWPTRIRMPTPTTRPGYSNSAGRTAGALMKSTPPPISPSSRARSGPSRSSPFPIRSRTSRPRPPVSARARSLGGPSTAQAWMRTTSTRWTRSKCGSVLMGGPQPTWVQYEFDNTYKLDRLLVWNFNQMLEPVLGVGARNVTVEYSADGAAWTALGDFEFAQAPGKATYTADIIVDFGGAVARYVKLTIHSNWRGCWPNTA